MSGGSELDNSCLESVFLVMPGLSPVVRPRKGCDVMGVVQELPCRRNPG